MELLRHCLLLVVLTHCLYKLASVGRRELIVKQYCRITPQSIGKMSIRLAVLLISLRSVLVLSAGESNKSCICIQPRTEVLEMLPRLIGDAEEVKKLIREVRYYESLKSDGLSSWIVQQFRSVKQRFLLEIDAECNVNSTVSALCSIRRLLTAAQLQRLLNVNTMKEYTESVNSMETRLIELTRVVCSHGTEENTNETFGSPPEEVFGGNKPRLAHLWNTIAQFQIALEAMRTRLSNCDSSSELRCICSSF